MTAADRASTVVSNDEFKASIAPLTDGLTRFAIAMRDQPVGIAQLPAHDAPAMAELSAEAAWATPAWNEPVRAAHTFGGVLAYVLAEQLDALSVIMSTATVGPAFSYLPNVRASFEAVPVTHWINEPGIGAERRIKRGVVLRLESASQLGRMKAVPSAALHSQRTQAQCLAFADHHHWQVARSSVGGWIVGGETQPRAAEVYSKIAFGENDRDLDGVVWNYTSAAQHATLYPFFDGLGEHLLDADPLDPHGRIAAITVKAQNMHTLGIMCWYGCDAVVKARAESMGWPATDELVAARASLADHARAVIAALKHLAAEPDI